MWYSLRLWRLTCIIDIPWMSTSPWVCASSLSYPPRVFESCPLHTHRFYQKVCVFHSIIKFKHWQFCGWRWWILLIWRVQWQVLLWVHSSHSIIVGNFHLNLQLCLYMYYNFYKQKQPSHENKCKHFIVYTILHYTKYLESQTTWSQHFPWCIKSLLSPLLIKRC